MASGKNPWWLLIQMVFIHAGFLQVTGCRRGIVGSPLLLSFALAHLRWWDDEC